MLLKIAANNPPTMQISTLEVHRSEIVNITQYFRVFDFFRSENLLQYAVAIVHRRLLYFIDFIFSIPMQHTAIGRLIFRHEQVFKTAYVPIRPAIEQYEHFFSIGT